MPHEYENQPWKSLYLTYQGITTLFFRLPVWTLWFLPSSNRPRTTWTLKRTLIRQAVREAVDIMDKTGPLNVSPDHHAIVEGPNVKAVWIPAVPELIVGKVKQWAEISGLDSVSIPGYWLEKKGVDKKAGAPPEPGEKVLYSFHGGCYGGQSAHPDNPMSTAPRSVVNITSIDRALALEYRKSKPAPDPISFPAALIDAVAGYNYLIKDVGFRPEDIILFGDSSGGNLALALARYLVENKETAGLPPPPGGMIINSSYADLGHSDRNHKDSSIFTNLRYDFYTMESLDDLRDWFLGPFGQDGARLNPYISPASESLPEPISFVGFPRTLNFVGGLEILRDQNRVLNERMEKDMGKDMVTYVEMPDAVHDFLMFEWHQPEQKEALQIIENWLKSA